MINNDRNGAIKLSNKEEKRDCIEKTLGMWDSDYSLINSAKNRDIDISDIRIARSLGSFEEREGVYVLLKGLNKGISLYTRHDLGDFGFASRRYICGSLPQDIADSLNSTYEYVFSEGVSLTDRKTYYIRVGYDGISVRVEEKEAKPIEKNFFIYPGNFYKFEEALLSANLLVESDVPNVPCSAYTLQRLNLHSSKIDLDGVTYLCPGIDASTSNKIVSGNLSGNINQIISAINILIPKKEKILLPVLPIKQLNDTADISKDDFYAAVKGYLQKVKEKYSSEVSESHKLGVWWISEDGLNIINDDSLGIELNHFSCETDLDSQSIFKELSQLIGSEIDKIMIQNGFKINQKNSSKSIADDQFYDYIRAYEKDSIKAIFKADPDCGTNSERTPAHYTFSFGFTSTLEDNYQRQAPYLKDLRLNNEIIRIEREAEDFAYINVNARRSGFYIIAKLINGKWEKLFSGQDYPSCNIIKKYKIPREIVSECFSNETNNLIKVF